MKTNAARVLDRLGIEYELREYDVSPDDLSAGTGGSQDRLTSRSGLQDSRRPWGPMWNLSSRNFRKPRAELQGAPKPDRGSEDRPGSCERSASLDRLHSRRSYRSGMQEGLPGIYRRTCGNLQRDLGVGRHTRAADLAGSCRLHPSGQGHGRSYRKGEVTWPLSAAEGWATPLL
jgi:hypothetical protein